MNWYPQILGVMDTLNEWNDKLNELLSGKLDNVGTGLVVMGVILFVTIIGVRALNK